ncbi:MAG: DUF2490 domain-containing protein [Ferruginibacter sp.]
MKNIITAVTFLLFSSFSFAQEQRLADHNTIGWFAYTGSFKIKPKLAIHTEYQWRRVETIKNWQQGLFRTGLNYAVRKDVNIIVGYAFAQTYVYGDYPPAFAFPEHRIFEQVIIKNSVGSLDLSHRFTLEQRFVGRVGMPNGNKNTDYPFLNRIRYRLRAELPLHKKSAPKKPWSIIAQDEVFIGWGKNIGANIFDQNRLGLLIGYKLNNILKLEAGYINQTVQQPRRVNDKSVYQYNNGFLLAANFNFDLIKK